MKHINKGYYRIKTANGWVYENRHVAEQKYGRKLKVSEVAHHIDHNKLNNDPDNIIIMTKSEHFKYHGKNPSDETRKRKSLANMGAKNWNYHRIRSEEHQGKIAKALRGRKRPKHSEIMTKWHTGDIHFNITWKGFVIRIAHKKDMSVNRYIRLIHEGAPVALAS